MPVNREKIISRIHFVVGSWGERKRDFDEERFEKNVEEFLSSTSELWVWVRLITVVVKFCIRDQSSTNNVGRYLENLISFLD